jgi:hypothetical protein
MIYGSRGIAGIEIKIVGDRSSVGALAATIQSPAVVRGSCG